MIKFNNIDLESPYQLFKLKYDKAINAQQKNIHVCSISSFSKDTHEVDSRYVNIKFINGTSFIFFSNYQSNKALQFLSHKQVSMLFFWDKINTQIRIKGFIKKLDADSNQKYFSNRSLDKNALAISSYQSRKIKSFDEVLNKYKKTFKEKDLKSCPEYWGGYSIAPYQFEFWEGHRSRLNKRELFSFDKNKKWEKTILEP